MLTSQELATDLLEVTDGDLEKALDCLRQSLDSGRHIPSDMVDLMIGCRDILLEMDRKANPHNWKQWS